ncbi:DinB family protein [Paenibacillus sp. N1-5-1-14]|uniref:DinB family protein n=1 Tax=Paenibacillus radicibacter TaxID=2972488 RepID=UPI0021595320|nr:DinB family protein [Paenibacillus radicibacter]MCR8644777.1 DinB family protein [Paenibacillus radicibacter]
MDHLLLFQMKMARDWCIEVAESCPNELSVIQLDVFNNTIQWQVGHILTVTERMLFQYPGDTTLLPSNFTKWFESGTSPANWTEQPPSLNDLITLLYDQQTRLLAIPPEKFEEILTKPFFGFFRYGECAGFTILHETLHVGKMEEMIRLLRQ